jgi:NADH dehydrogenase FAD-containing subunit
LCKLSLFFTNIFFRNGLITDEYLRVKNSNGTIYAIGDCSVVEQEKLIESVDELFQKADRNADGTLTMEEFTGK